MRNLPKASLKSSLASQPVRSIEKVKKTVKLLLKKNQILQVEKYRYVIILFNDYIKKINEWRMYEWYPHDFFYILKENIT